jgi:hypothetical protein
MRVTKQQLRFLHEIEQLDRIRLGCLAVSAKFTQKRAEHIERQCIARGWLRSAPFEHPWGRVLYLTSRGLRRLQRSQRAHVMYQPHLPLGETQRVEQ